MRDVTCDSVIITRDLTVIKHHRYNTENDLKWKDEIKWKLNLEGEISPQLADIVTKRGGSPRFCGNA